MRPKTIPSSPNRDGSLRPPIKPAPVGAIAYAASFFFIWGFLGKMNNVISPFLKDELQLTYTGAMLVQLSFFLAYALAAVPTGMLVSRIGYRSGIAMGLFLAAIGTGVFALGTSLRSHPILLFALFTTALGIVVLQVSANPLVIAAGTPAGASRRLNLCQAFNSLGAVIAPLVGALLFFPQDSSDTGLQASNPILENVVHWYTMGSFTLLAVSALVFLTASPPDFERRQALPVSALLKTIKRRRVAVGAASIFLYVGAEVGIGVFLVDYLALPSVAELDRHTAARYISIYFSGAMVGRFISALAMRWLKANRILAVNTLLAIALVVTSICTTGVIAMWAILLVGLCNSVIFPTVFALGSKQLGSEASLASGIFCGAIVGGAVLPLMQGALTDASGLRAGLLVPVTAYSMIFVLTTWAFRDTPEKTTVRETVISNP